jgi:DNA-binding NarL/FixJ family response regulator
MKPKIRVLIVDDHDIHRKGMLYLLREIPAVEVVGESSNGRDFLIQLDEKDPVDVVFLDLKMPHMDGVEATQLALEKHPNLKVIIVSMYSEQDDIEKMINIGVSGFLLKNVDQSIIEKALTVCYAGGNFFSEEILPLLTRAIKNKNSTAREQITDKELSVLELICHGYTSQEISAKLELSVRTVEGYKASLIKKTGVSNTLNLVIHSIKNNLVNF